MKIRISTHHDSENFQYYMWNYTEDWEITSSYYTTCFFDPEKNSFYTQDPDPVYYCWKQGISRSILTGSTESLRENRIVNFPLLSIPASEEKISVLYSILVKQRALSKEAYDYYLNLQKQNEGMGGLFTPQPSEVQGNIGCTTNPDKKVLGYVSVLKNVEEERIFISSLEIEAPFYGGFCTEYDEAFFAEERLDTPADKYRAGYRPVGDIIPLSWSDTRCVDCTANGGSKKKPSFWPNKHQ